MPARKRPGLSENTRLRIKTTMIVKRLVDHIDGKNEMSTSQIRAAEILLKKTLPDLQSIEAIVEDKRENVIADKPIDDQEWETEFGVVPAEGTATRTH